MKMRMQVFIVLAIFVSFISGCNKATETISSKQPPGLPQDTLAMSGASKAPSVNVFLDASVSMRGYVPVEGQSHYTEVLSAMESAIISGWPNGQAGFFKFGSVIEPLPERAYLKASSQGFYIEKDTKIEEVIQASVVDDLTVIVTDLFQSDSDVTLLIKLITDKYIAQGYAVGIVGIQSEFQGLIYDVGLNRHKFAYDSGIEDTSRFRPFYLLMLGKHADILHYHESLRRSLITSTIEPSVFIISKYLNNPILDFRSSTIKKMNKLVEVESLYAGERQELTKQLKLKASKNESDAHNLELDLGPLQLLPYAPVLNNGQLDVSVDICSADKSLLIMPTLLVDAKLQGQTIGIKLDFLPKDIAESTTYLADISIRPKADLIATPAWIRSWNMDSSKIRHWVEKPDEFEGFTTLNLHRFVDGLWRANWQLHKPIIARLYCYFRK